jgi:hypothetical protein
VTVCQTVTVIVQTIVALVLRTIFWPITTVVCLFSDPAQAFEALPDFFAILFDAVEGLTGLAEALLSDVAGMLEDTDRHLDSLASSLGPLGLLLSPLKGAVQWTRRLTENARDLLGGVKDLVFGALLGNSCRFARGATNIGVAVGVSVASVSQLGGAIFAGGRDLVDRRVLEVRILRAINEKFGADSVRANRIIDAFAIGSSPMGPVFVVEPYRLFLASTNFTRQLHIDGVINVFALAGYTSKCRQGLSEPEGEVVYAGTSTRVSHADLNEFVDNGPDGVPSFRLFAISSERFRQHLEVAKRKVVQVGVQLRFAPLAEFPATIKQHVPLAVDDGGPLGDRVQQDIFRAMGRNGVNDDLSRIPMLAHFHYVPTVVRDGKSDELFGLTSPWWPSREVRTASGVSYRNVTPDFFSRIVPIHEIGHYLGLLHENSDTTVLRGVDEIMFKNRKGDMFKGSMFYEYLLLGGEPRFTQSDVKTVWNWIMTDAESILP